MKRIALNWLLASTILILLIPSSAKAEEVTVAVATNFLLPARAISSAYEEATGHSVILVAGATGKLATQILAGAPFDVFLSADQARPKLLMERNAAVADSRFTYAIGNLVMWSRKPLPLTGSTLDSVDKSRVSRLAMANPKLAPYGLAAQQTLDSLGLTQSLAGRFVYGENVGQTFAMAASGNATVGLIAKSQLVSLPEDQRGYWIDVPANLHDPIRQDGIVTRRAEENIVARSFVEFLKSAKSARIISRFGYGVPGS